MTSVAKPPPGGKSTSIVKQDAAPDFGDGQRRVRDIDLGEWLGLSRPRKVRELIERVFPEGERPNSRPTVGRQSTGHGASRTYEVREYWLTEAEAIFLIARSRTKVAPDALRRTLAQLATPKDPGVAQLAAAVQALTVTVQSLAHLQPSLNPEVAARRAKWREQKRRQAERKALTRQTPPALPDGQPPNEPPKPPVVAPAPAVPGRPPKLDAAFVRVGFACLHPTDQSSWCGEIHRDLAGAWLCRQRAIVRGDPRQAGYIVAQAVEYLSDAGQVQLRQFVLDDVPERQVKVAQAGQRILDGLPGWTLRRVVESFDQISGRGGGLAPMLPVARA